MNLHEYKFPKLTGLDMAFSTLGTDLKLLAEAKARGYYNGDKDGNKKFSQLFYTGGSVEFRKDVPAEFIDAAWPYCRSLMRSFEPKHEAKDAICGMLLDELVASVKPAERKATV